MKFLYYFDVFAQVEAPIPHYTKPLLMKPPFHKAIVLNNEIIDMLTLLFPMHFNTIIDE